MEFQLFLQTYAIPEMIKHNVSGYLINFKEIEHELIEYIEKLLSNERLRKKFGNNARKVLKEKFSIEINKFKLLQIYSKVLSNQ